MSLPGKRRLKAKLSKPTACDPEVRNSATRWTTFGIVECLEMSRDSDFSLLSDLIVLVLNPFWMTFELSAHSSDSGILGRFRV